MVSDSPWLTPLPLLSYSATQSSYCFTSAISSARFSSGIRGVALSWRKVCSFYFHLTVLYAGDETGSSSKGANGASLLHFLVFELSNMDGAEEQVRTIWLLKLSLSVASNEREPKENLNVVGGVRERG